MKHRYLGESGLLVSRVCLGTMTFGTPGWGCDQAAADAITASYLDAGGNFIDTADMYADGVSEEMLAKSLQGRPRDGLVLATKCWFRMPYPPGEKGHPNAKGLSRKHVVDSVEKSLKRLGADFIDLFQLHGPDPNTPIEETLRACDDLVRAGKVRYLGCSNLFAWQMVKANAVAELRGLAPLVSSQNLYNLLRRDIERDILPACEAEGMGVLCWSANAGGLLTGKYDRNSGPPEGSRVGIRAKVDLPRYWNDDSFKVIDETVAVAKELGWSPVQVAVSWLLGERRVTSVIVGARTAEQIAPSLAAGAEDLPQELRDRLTDVVGFEHGYPRDWMESSFASQTGHETIEGDQGWPSWAPPLG
ncbi:General stress protein 69 [Pseudobythopirellula maris]|uniref:General stress protein 69 n=1 Tax=Pseudobythopirellula maris TaxID=2527991 RepID=A0A5C5ZRE0_9BACT|nr:aldo/keto reductase [Pseudobythopirellula maris]TWT89860.1 General stress protein 69 [Pseudobythopirellula maris]